MKNYLLAPCIGVLTLGVAVPCRLAEADEKPGKLNRTPTAINVVFGFDPGKGKYDGVSGRPDDTWNLLDVRQTSIKNLRGHGGRETPVRLSVSENDGEWGIKDHAGIYHAYIYHNSRSVDLKATFDHLPSGFYRVYVYAHGDAPDQNANVEIAVGDKVIASKATANDGTWKFRSKEFAEGVQFVSFEIVVRDSKPVQITSKRAGSTYSMLNAIQIVRLMK